MVDGGERRGEDEPDFKMTMNNGNGATEFPLQKESEMTLAILGCGKFMNSFTVCLAGRGGAINKKATDIE